MQKPFFLLLLVLTAACSELYVDTEHDTAINPVLSTKAGGGCCTPYSFSKVNTRETWIANKSLISKFEVCQVPDSLLSEMTTEAVIESRI